MELSVSRLSFNHQPRVRHRRAFYTLPVPFVSDPVREQLGSARRCARRVLSVSPALPKEVRPALHSVVVESLRSMGKADDMSEDGFRHLPPPLGNAHNYPNTASQCTLDYDLTQPQKCISLPCLYHATTVYSWDTLALCCAVLTDFVLCILTTPCLPHRRSCHHVPVLRDSVTCTYRHVIIMVDYRDPCVPCVSRLPPRCLLTVKSVEGTLFTYSYPFTRVTRPHGRADAPRRR